MCFWCIIVAFLVNFVHICTAATEQTVPHWHRLRQTWGGWSGIFSNQFDPWFFLNGRVYTKYYDFTLVLRGWSLVIWNLIGSDTGNKCCSRTFDPSLLPKQGEAVSRHSSSPTGIFTHLCYFQLGKVFVLSFSIILYIQSHRKIKLLLCLHVTTALL